VHSPVLSRAPLSKWLVPTAVIVIFSIAFSSSPVQAQTYSILYTFTGGSSGNGPSDLVVAPNGTIYGVAQYGNCACYLIFSLNQGKLTVLHRFTVSPGSEAEVPQGLLLSKNGQFLYGTTSYGGKYTGYCESLGGCGIAFSYNLTTDTFKIMHEFSGQPTDGMDPAGTEVLDSAGNLYGLTWGGGTGGFGTLYEFAASGAEKVLYSFQNPPDAEHPGDGIVLYGGNFWGVSIQGGANTCNNGGCGAIFRVTPQAKETILYSFTGGTDGQNPYELVGDNAGNFYGISRNGSNQVVAIFEINTKGQFSIAYDGSFVSQIQWITPGPNGTLYGIATGGNATCANGCGEIFQLAPTGGGNGTITILHAFDGTDGSYPQIQSLVVNRGVLYGSTYQGGSTNDGVVFKLIP
jgi:uncharacterized repeat protein (TIGR03803 family)